MLKTSAVSLLDLVEQDRPSRGDGGSHGLGQLAALVVADVSRWRADHPRYRMALGVLGHVQANHAPVRRRTVHCGQRPCQLRLAHAGRSEKDERTRRAVGILQTRSRPPHRADTAVTAASWPITRRCSSAFEMNQLVCLTVEHPFAHGTPVHVETIAAMSSSPTSSLSNMRRRAGNSAKSACCCRSSSVLQARESSRSATRRRAAARPSFSARSASLAGLLDLLLDLTNLRDRAVFSFFQRPLHRGQLPFVDRSARLTLDLPATLGLRFRVALATQTLRARLQLHDTSLHLVNLGRAPSRSAVAAGPRPRRRDRSPCPGGNGP